MGGWTDKVRAQSTAELVATGPVLSASIYNDPRNLREDDSDWGLAPRILTRPHHHYCEVFERPDIERHLHSSALTVADALRDADVRKGAKWVEWVDASGAVVQFRMGETNPMLRAKGSDPWMACLSLLVGTLDRDATLIDAEVAP